MHKVNDPPAYISIIEEEVSQDCEDFQKSNKLPVIASSSSTPETIYKESPKKPVIHKAFQDNLVVLGGNTLEMHNRFPSMKFLNKKQSVESPQIFSFRGQDNIVEEEKEAEDEAIEIDTGLHNASSQDF